VSEIVCFRAKEVQVDCSGVVPEVRPLRPLLCLSASDSGIRCEIYRVKKRGLGATLFELRNELSTLAVTESSSSSNTTEGLTGHSPHVARSCVSDQRDSSMTWVSSNWGPTSLSLRGRPRWRVR
jgi:hypothetical protein